MARAGQRRRRLGVAGVVCLVAALWPSTTRAKTIVYGGDHDYPPYESLDERGEPTGFNVDLIRAIAREAGFEVKVHLGPWATIRRGLEVERTIDVSDMFRTAERESIVDFTEPFTIAYHELFARVGNESGCHIDQLAGRCVLAQGAAFGSDYLRHQPGVEIVEVESEPEALRRLAAGECDCALVSQFGGRYALDRYELHNLAAVGPPVQPLPYAFVVLDGRKELLAELDRGLARVRASGEYSRIYSRWFGRYDTRPRSAWAVLRDYAVPIGVALAIVLAAFAWLLTLRRQVAKRTDELRAEMAEQRRIEERRHHAQRLEGLGRLAGVVSHDFNNLLTVITAHAAFLRRGRGPEQQAESIVEIAAACDRAAALTRQLLAFSRRQVTDPLVIDVNAAVKSAAKLIERAIGDQIELVVSGADEPLSVKADLGQFDQILLNLAVNARDAMPDGGTLRIDVRSATCAAGERGELPAGDYVEIAVRDTGVGIAPDVMAQIFEPFFTTKAVGKGTGLGLATVRDIVAAAGGAITVDSELGKGSSFRVLLPAVDATPVRPAAPEPEAPITGNERVLVVEDEDQVRDVIRRAFEARGYQVLEAPDGDAALALADADDGGVDLLVTDLVMPGMNGRAVAEALRERVPDLPVLFVSGYATEDVFDPDAGLPPSSAMMPKPFRPEQLVRRARELLDAAAA